MRMWRSKVNTADLNDFTFPFLWWWFRIFWAHFVDFWGLKVLRVIETEACTCTPEHPSAHFLSHSTNTHLCSLL